ncbi:helix-turn-helix domain-containing protein [Streptomyces sp. SID4919]|nr:helix-turn-helix domain-containing protein [Streptomyces sp. SID4919]MYY09458.1 helix-turn-helix domain-containing protein [Streptomyces sp. SID4919]SCK59808.1 Predicted transcriptional regulators [Streptomyces sp. AmelKG-E11A]
MCRSKYAYVLFCSVGGRLSAFGVPSHGASAVSRKPVPLPPPKERRRLREARSLSQEDVAARVGVTRETVRSWETGRTDPRGRKRDAYAAFLVAIAREPAPPAEASGAPGPPGAAPDLPAPGPPGPARGDGAGPPPRHRPGAGRPARGPKASTQRSTKPPLAGQVRHSHAPPPGGTSPLNAIAQPAALMNPFGRRHAADGSLLTAERAAGLSADQAFDRLYGHSAPALVRQTYLLTGRRALAQESVERAFHQAWQRWPEVAVDRDPAGWVRAAAYEYAMAPWHRFRPALRRPDPPPASPEDHALLDTLMSLPPMHRRTLLLYDGVGLDLPETAAETEASTPAAAYRLLRARRSVAERLPVLADPDALHQGLDRLARGEKLQPPRVAEVRSGCERRTRFWTRTAIAFTVLILGATALTLRTAPTAYEPPEAPPETVRGVPPRMGPGPLTDDRLALRDLLREAPRTGPHRTHPELR